jgi:hypothetical protein
VIDGVLHVDDDQGGVGWNRHGDYSGAVVTPQTSNRLALAFFNAA